MYLTLLCKANPTQNEVKINFIARMYQYEKHGTGYNPAWTMSTDIEHFKVTYVLSLLLNIFCPHRVSNMSVLTSTLSFQNHFDLLYFKVEFNSICIYLSQHYCIHSSFHFSLRTIENWKILSWSLTYNLLIKTSSVWQWRKPCLSQLTSLN
jgi:hypothetical protein